MSRPALEVADIFRDHGAAWRSANAGHVSLDQLKVMSAIERCAECGLIRIAYNSCLMGKFRNGESAGGRVADPPDFQMIANDFSALYSP